jgi:hypothetical protein
VCFEVVPTAGPHSFQTSRPEGGELLSAYQAGNISYPEIRQAGPIGAGVPGAPKFFALHKWFI